MRKFYGHTNESLWAVISGMNVSKDDRVLTICGSGDQAFALVEYAREVLAVDIEAKQIDYAKKRLEALKKGNYEDFFPLFDDKEFPLIKNEKFIKGPSGDKLRYLHFMCAVKIAEEPMLATWSGSIRYFLGESEPFLIPPYANSYDSEKIHRIRENLGRISFCHGDIADLLKRDSNFSRVYLSNAFLSWRFHEDSRNKSLDFLNLLPIGCLVYSTETGDKQEATPHSCWRLDEDLSAKARKAELSNSWNPKVYRKIA